MIPQDLATTKKIATVCVHMDRKTHCIKCYKILAGEINNALFDRIEQLVHVCAHLTNFQSPLVA